MATLKHGRNGAIYVSSTSGGAAVSLSGKTKWSINMSVDSVDATSFGDTTKTYLAGLPDGSVDFEGFYDFAADAIFTAATDGLARKVYLYPDSTDTTKYFFLTGTLDVSMDTPVNGAVQVKGTIKPRTSVCLQGIS